MVKALKLVGIGDVIFSDSKEELLSTTLGSCVGVTIFCPERNIAGLAHIVLPESKLDKNVQNKKVGFYADSAIVYFFNEFLRISKCKEKNKIQIKLTGGASVANLDASLFNVGSRNIDTARLLIKNLGYKIAAEDVGGDIYRNIKFDPTNGKVMISNLQKGKWSI